MIEEPMLSDLLAARAERIPVPEHALESLLEESRATERTALVARVARPPVRVLAAAAAVLVVVGAGFALVRTGSDSSSTAARKPVAVQTGRTSAAKRSADATGGDVYAYNGSSGAGIPPTAHFSVTTTGKTDSSSGGASGPTASRSTATDTARVIKTGAIDLRLARHSFGTMVGRATTIAASEDGFVSDASTNESAATPSGHLTVRVPSKNFDDSVRRLRALGKVLTASTRGADVTGQYTDLQARLHAAGATREAYLTVLAKATNIGDILAVQDRIESVQTQIEQLQGQINDLDNRTTYATITLSMSEPGPKPKPVVKPHHRSGLATAWDNARDGFARRVEAIISHSGSVLVITIGLLLLALALRLFVPRARRLFV